MALRLQELHPALVHFPIALMPVSLIADLIGRITDDDAILELGRLTMPIAAASNAVAGAAGLIAQEAVQGDDEASKLLVTHRTLNIAALGVTTLMALRRVGQKRPGIGYLAMGLATLGVVSYSAYLGSKMVYAKGMGVEAADGLKEDAAPELRFKNAGGVAKIAAGHIRDGIKHAAEDASQGQLVPVLRTDAEEVKEDLVEEAGERLYNGGGESPSMMSE